MLNLKENIKYRNILRRSINQNFEKAKYIMENFSENDNFNELLAIKTVTSEKYLKIKTLNEDILNIPYSNKFWRGENLAQLAQNGKNRQIKSAKFSPCKLLFEQEGDNDREIESEKKTSDEFDLKYRTNLFQIEGFMTNDSISETAENNSREVRLVPQ